MSQCSPKTICLSAQIVKAPPRITSFVQTPNMDATYEYQQFLKNLLYKEDKTVYEGLEKQLHIYNSICSSVLQNEFFGKSAYYFAKHRSRSNRDFVVFHSQICVLAEKSEVWGIFSL